LDFGEIYLLAEPEFLTELSVPFFAVGKRKTKGGADEAQR